MVDGFEVYTGLAGIFKFIFLVDSIVLSLEFMLAKENFFFYPVVCGTYFI
jgi:hypothetical protein